MSHIKICYLDFLRVVLIPKAVDEIQIPCWPKIIEIESPEIP